MNSSRLFQTLSIIILVAMTVMFISCDEPNKADQPPYSLAAVYPTPGVAQDVDVSGDFAGIADDRSGVLVLNVANLSSISVEYSRRLRSANSTCETVALDMVHRFVVIGTDDPQTGFYFYSMDQDTYIVGVGYGLPLRDFEVESYEDTIRAWASDFNDGFLVSQKVKSSDTTWMADPQFVEPAWLPPQGEIRGFGRRSDNVFAIACGAEGVYFLQGTPRDTLSHIDLPGIAYDCAWLGETHLVVAAQYHVLVLDVTNMNTPVLTGSLSVAGADRLQDVVIQGSMAALIDVNDGVYIVDVSNPSAPRYVQLLDAVDPSALDCDPNGNRLFVTDRGQGLLVFTK